MDRRKFAICCAALWAVPAAAVTASPRMLPLNSMCVVGSWYLRENTSRESLVELLDHLEYRAPGMQRSFLSQESNIDQDVIRAACALDYQSGDTVYIGGWLLAKTEVSLCALAAVSDSSA